MNPEILNRKGSRKVNDIPKEVLKLLNEGKIETVNLTEWLAIDHAVLTKTTLPKIGISKQVVDLIRNKINEQKKPTAMNSVKLIGGLLFENLPKKTEREKIFKSLSNHQSDSVRCYAPYLIALNEDFSIKEKLEKLKDLVADQHFGIREVVWMAIRPEIDKNLDQSIKILSKWAKNEDDNIRRFTTEATRPRGVWCKHIEKLKEKPDLALSILEELKSDKSKYVQDSLGNWLNDASKSQPDFVIDLCKRWQKESPTKETERIIKRAKRTIDKK